MGISRVGRDERKEMVYEALVVMGKKHPDKTYTTSDIARMVGIGNSSYLRGLLFELYDENSIDGFTEDFASQTGYRYRWYCNPITDPSAFTEEELWKTLPQEDAIPW